MTRWISPSLLTAVLLAPQVAAQVSAEPHARTSQQKIEDLAAYWRFGPLTLGEAVATACMLLALGLVAFAVGRTVADATQSRWFDPSTVAPLAGGVAILTWSFLVRFVLTEPNILTDGGSGYSRLMRYTEGYGGLAVLVKLLPFEWSSFMWRAMVVPRVLATLSPALLVWLAREIGFPRAVALIAGLALACLPIHAALTASDLLVGSMSSLQLAGLALVLAARRAERPDLFATGAALTAWAMWVRPEGVLGLLPVAAVSLSFPRRWWRRRDVQAVLVGLTALVALRAVALASSPYLTSDSSPGPLRTVAWGTVLFSTVLVPVWLWMPAPFAVPALIRHRALAVTLAGLTAGLTPVYLRGLSPDPANTHLEALRYGLPALAWLALISAVGLDTVCRWLADRWPANQRKLLLGSHSLVALLVASPVILHHEYLARRYGHSASEEAIRPLLRQVPDGCGLLVPDDFAERVNIEIYQRYAFIAAEAFAQGEARAIEVRPVSDLLDGNVNLDQCWTFLRGPYCYHAFAAQTAKACDDVAARFELKEIDSIPIEFRHHRLVSGPDVQCSPWYMQRMPVVLYRVAATR